MNILHVLPGYIPAYRLGGPIISVHNLSKKLVENGHNVTIYTTNFDGENVMKVPLNKAKYIDGVKVYYFSVNFPYFYFRSKDLKYKLEKTVKQFDIVHIHGIYVYTTLIGSKIAKKFNIPYIISPRGMLDKVAIQLKGTLKKKIYLKLFERKNFLNAKLIHYTSREESLKSYFSNLKKKKIIIFNGIDFKTYIKNKINKFTPKYQNLNKKKIVLFLGRINYIKGLDILIRSWKKVLKHCPVAHLVIAGPDDNGYKKILQKKIKNLKIHKNITFTGNLNHNDKIMFLKNMNILISTSYLESFGMSIAEAMIFSKPVIVSNKVNIHSIIKKYDAGIVVNHDENIISSSIIKVLSDKKLSKKLGKNGHKLLTENFNLESVSLKMLNIYESIEKKS